MFFFLFAVSWNMLCRFVWIYEMKFIRRPMKRDSSYVLCFFILTTNIALVFYPNYLHEKKIPPSEDRGVFMFIYSKGSRKSNKFITSLIGLSTVSSGLPAKRSPTKLLSISSTTDPESPPSLIAPVIIWFTNVA